MGNPYAFQGALDKLDAALREAIAAIEGEVSRMGSAANENTVLQKFRAWSAELQHLRSQGQGGGQGRQPGNPQEGPLFTD